MQQIGSIVILVALVATGTLLIREKEATLSPTSSLPTISVPFTELLQGEDAKVSKRVNYLIASDEGLKELWKLLNTKSAMPDVDFNTHSIVAIFSGEQTSGGHGIQIARIEDTGVRTVYITRTEPGVSCMTTQSLTTPFQIVRVDNTDLEFVHQDEVVSAECN